MPGCMVREGEEGEAADQRVERARSHDDCRPPSLADVESAGETGVSLQLGARAHLLRAINSRAIDLLARV